MMIKSLHRCAQSECGREWSWPSLDVVSKVFRGGTEMVRCFSFTDRRLVNHMIRMMMFSAKVASHIHYFTKDDQFKGKAPP